MSLSVLEHVAVLRIDRPEAKNAVDGSVAAGLEAGLDRIEADPDLRVGVLHGGGGVFSAGADLRAVQAGGADSLMTERGGFAGFVRRHRAKPFVAAVDGAALGGGAELVFACDLVVAGRDATFGLPEVRRGLVAGAGGIVRAGRWLPRAVAMEVLLTGEPISAETALAFGMVNVVCDEGAALGHALLLAGRVAANAPVAVQATRRAALAAETADEDTCWELSSQAADAVLASEDMAEGIMAFIERRPPVWRGR